MKRILLFTLALAVAMVSCSENDPAPSANAIIGAYSGVYSYKAPFSYVTDTYDDHTLLITRNADDSRLYDVTIDGFSRIIILHGVSRQSEDSFSGDVFIYELVSDIGIPGEEIAGVGSFVFSNGTLDLIWTADKINTEWKITFRGTLN